MEETLILLKPDTIRRKLVGEIIARLEKKNLTICRMKMVSINRETAECHYEHICKKPFFQDLMDYITSGPSVAIVVSGEKAISVVRNMIGVTNSLEAVPGSIRGDYGLGGCENLVHASDSYENALIEINRFFS